MLSAKAYQDKYAEYLQYFEKSLNTLINGFDGEKPQVIKEAMAYAVSGGGKRIRPILCYATCEMLGGNFREVENFALAIELIHSYSLVHDDLPSMDNDDYRRGKLSTHKKFGEAFGVLCGDALLNLAYEVCLSKKNFDSSDLKSVSIIAEYAGYKGMISGQVNDILGEQRENKEEKFLYEIYADKTAKLLTAPLLVASIKNGNAYYGELKEIGERLGILFQITDDILDVESNREVLGKSTHKDEEENKYTAVKVFGLDGAKKKNKEIFSEIKRQLSKIPNADFLESFVEKIYYRKS